MCVDLHTHSLYSDGTASPAELVQLAVDSGLRALALTDHDTIEGIGEFLSCDNDHELDLIPGLEINAQHRGFSLHILGYGFNHRNGDLARWLTRLQQGRASRNMQIISKLQKMGLDIHHDELATISQHGQTGRPHIARLLRNKGIVQSISDAFALYLRNGGPAWAERFSYSASESIDMIHRAGGLAVLAHPGILKQQTQALSLVIAELAERGLDGIEVYYPAHSPKMEKNLRSIARKYQLVLTGGSDYHGIDRTFSALAGGSSGFCPPDVILEPIRERLRTIQNVNSKKRPDDTP